VGYQRNQNKKQDYETTTLISKTAETIIIKHWQYKVFFRHEQALPLNRNQPDIHGIQSGVAASCFSALYINWKPLLCYVKDAVVLYLNHSYSITIPVFHSLIFVVTSNY